MTGKTLLAAMVFLLATSAQAQPRYEPEEPPEYRERRDEREAYRRGFERGFERGYAKGLDEGQRRVAPPPPPPPLPAPPRLGPIRITGAFYGTTSKNCDATRYVGGRANGKRSSSFEVTNTMCGDPARGDRKSLEVTYRCGEIIKTASAYEHRTIYLDCNSP